MHCTANQDRWVRDFFGPYAGRCLEIGARDGQMASQTRQLIESGWHAVLVEPHEVNCKAMQSFYASLGALDRCIIVQAAIVPESHQGDTVDMYDHVDPCTSKPSGCSSLDPSWARWCGLQFAGTDQLWETKVPCMSVSRLVQTVGVDFDFVTIDAEGQSISIARAMPWEKMPTRLLSVEGKRTDLAVLDQIGWECREILDADLMLTRSPAAKSPLSL